MSRRGGGVRLVRVRHPHVGLGTGLIFLLVRTCWRFFVTGQSVSGRDTDNATFLHAATKDYRDKPKEKLSGPIWQRLAVRWALLGIPGGLILANQLGALVHWAYGWAGLGTAPAWTGWPWFSLLVLWLFTVAAGTAGWQLWRAGVRYRNRGLYREFIEPGARVVCATLNVRYRERDARRLVQLPKRFADELADGEVPEPVRVNLPLGTGIDDRSQRNLVHAVGKVLGMKDPVAKWELKGSHPYVLLTPRPLPPVELTFDTVKARMQLQPVTQPLLGLAHGREVVTLDFENDSPHVLVSGASGTGKSVLTKLITAQRMHHGNGLIVIDYKRISHSWAHEVPGVIYAWRTAEMHEMCLAIGAELERRIENVVEMRKRGEQFVTVDVLVEEANTLISILREHWAAIKPVGAPAQSPAVSALQRLVFAGRELGMHAIYASQRGSANIFGGSGGDVRESFSTVLLAKWKLQTWKMLAGGIKFQRWPGGGRGLWGRIQDDELVLFRVPFLTDEQAKEWAMSGTPCPDTPLGGELRDARRPVIEHEGAGPELVTLSEALPLLPGPPVTLHAIRKAAQRAGFPAPAGKKGAANTYRLDELALWNELRASIESGETAADPFDSPGRRHAVVYAYDTYHPFTGAVVLGYVGQTVRRLAERDEEHRAGQPWADLIVDGQPRVIWEGDPTPAELDAIELDFIRELKPLYNYEGQEGAPHAIPKPTAVLQRFDRDDAAGRPRWSPIDVYSGRTS